MAKKNGRPKLSFEDKQARRGYIGAADLARRLDKHHSTIYRWIGAKKVKAEKVGDFQWVYLPSVESHLGGTAYRLYGLDKLHARMRGEASP